MRATLKNGADGGVAAVVTEPWMAARPGGHRLPRTCAGRGSGSGGVAKYSILFAVRNDVPDGRSMADIYLVSRGVSI